jgi:predicted outer membrane repeat protein
MYHSRPARKVRAYRPRLEVLENRTLLSTYVVDHLADDTVGTGTSGSLRYAITNAVDGDTITFGVTGTINLNGALPNLTHNFSIDGPGANLLTVNGNYHRLFRVTANTTSSISGLTIANGLAPRGGVSPAGGGGIANAGTLAVTNCTIFGNQIADYGGGSGGGIFNTGTLTLSNSTVSGNRAVSSLGEGVAGDGGGIYNGGTMIVTNSSISGNEAGTDGGGIYTDGTLTITNSTIFGNTAYGSLTFPGTPYPFCGGISGYVNMRNTILAGNMGGYTPYGGPDLYGSLATSGYNLIGDGTGGSGFVASDLVGTDWYPIDPLLGPLQDNGGPTQTMNLLPGSPAFGTGDPSVAGAPDQRGVTRLAPVSIGAVDPFMVTNLSDHDVRSLRAEIARNIPGAPINFAAGLSGTITLTTGELLLHQNVTITGPRANTISVSGNNASRVLEVFGGATATVSGLTITAGRVTGGNSGGGVLINSSGTLTLTSCSLSGNSAGSGSGIENDGTLTLTRSTLSGNSTTSGGAGGGIRNTGTLTVTNSTLSGNSAYQGGGIDNGGALALTSSTLSGNSAFFGAGIENDGTLTLTSSTLSGNSTSSGGAGGGIRNTGTLAVTNSTLNGNSAFQGGGIDNGGELTLTSVTLSANSTSTSGGGIFNNGTSPMLRNTIVAGNTSGATPSDISGNVDAGSSYNLIGTGGSGGLSDGINHNLVGVANPGLGSLADNGGPTLTMNVLPSSPAFGTGDPALATGMDQRGANRTTPTSIGAVDPLLVTNLSDHDIRSLRAEIGRGANGATINLASGLSGTITLTTGELQLNKSLIIPGPGANLLTVSGNHASRVFHVFGGATVTLSGLTITAGHLTGYGEDGAGVLIEGGCTLTLTNATVSVNSADRALHGGGISNGGTLTVTRSTISGNFTLGVGGGIDNGGTLTVTSCTLSGNTAVYGGGIGNQGGIAALTSSTVSGNLASAAGGIWNGDGYGALTLVTSCTVSGNSAVYGGGGIYSQVGLTTLRNTIVAGNASGGNPSDISGNVDAGSSYNLIGTGGSGGLINGVNHNQVGVANPGLGTLADNGGPTQTIALLPGSPAIAAGGTTYATATDQRGFARIVGGAVDIGAFEVQAAGQATHLSIQAPASTSAGTPFAITVTVLDDFGQQVTGYTGTVHFVASNGAMANYAFTATDGGQHTFFGLVLRRAGTLTVTGTDTADPSITGRTTFTITPAAADHLLFLEQPTDTRAGQTIRPAVLVAVVDAFGNVETGDNTDTLTLSLGTNPSGGTLSGTLTLTVVNGVAAFTDLSIDRAGMDYLLHATVGGGLPDSDSDPFTITSG